MHDITESCMSKALIKAYNLAGQKAGEWTSDATGAYGFNVPNGIYFVKPDGEKKTEKVVVLK